MNPKCAVSAALFGSPVVVSRNLNLRHNLVTRKENIMFGLFGKKKKPKNALDEVIFSIYGNPPPPKRANLGQAIGLANGLLMGVIDEREVGNQAIALNDGPIPYSTHDLALSIALNFFQKQEHVPQLFDAQILARMKILEWLQEGLVAPLIAQSFENVLYKLYKPG